MITYLKGTLAQKGELLTGGAYLVVDVGGVGYQVHTSRTSLIQAPSIDEPVMVYTSMIVREDSMQLVGFLSKEERELFDILSSASGVGMKMALALLSSLSISELSAAIMTADIKKLTIAKGVGPKLAQKLAIELKDKMSKWRDERMEHHVFASPQEKLPSIQSFQEAETVLLSLGYDVEEIYEGLKALQQSTQNMDSITSEEVLQHVLKWLATHPVR